MEEKHVKDRGEIILSASITGIVTNLVLAAVKVTIGIITGSLAVMSDAINNLTDSSSSLITIIGTKLAARKPDKNHPFGYGRVEYLTSMVIAVIVSVTGFEVLLSAVKGIRNPEPMSYTPVSLGIILLTVFAKIWLGSFTQKIGKSVSSGALVASGADAKNDALVSLVTLVSAGVYLLWDFSLDAYAGMVISFFILRTGFEVMRETMGKILGEKADSSLAENLRKDVEACPIVISAHDLILHNYGPGSNTGSINVELDHTLTIGEVYPVLHDLQRELRKKYHTYLVFGMYAVDTGAPLYQEVREKLNDFTHTHEHCLSFHAVNIDVAKKEMYCDIVLDYCADRKVMRTELISLLKKDYPEYSINVTVDTEFA